MQAITVSKERLLTTLTQNRAEHRDLFLKAQEAYRQKVIETLDRRLSDARSGRAFDTYIDLPEPVDYTDKFDEAIAMVEWAEGDTIELAQQDVNRYILNKWEWAREFAATTGSYLAR